MKWMNMHKNERDEWIKMNEMNEYEWKWKNGNEWIIMNKIWWRWMKINENWWKLMTMNENEWIWMKERFWIHFTNLIHDYGWL